MAATLPFQPRELTEEQKAKLLKAEQKVDKCEAELEKWSKRVEESATGSAERGEPLAVARQAFWGGERDKAQIQLDKLKVEFGLLPAGKYCLW